MAHFSPKEMADRLGTGLLAFPVTSFDSDLLLARGAFRDHLAWMMPHKPAGMFAPGGTGEFFSLTPDEVGFVLREAVAEVKGRLPVLSGVGYGTAIAVEMSKDVERGGADGILLLPPYLVNSTQEGLAAHVEAVCKSTSVGVIVYNRDNAVLQADTLAGLCERCPNLVGVKDGVGDIELAVRIESKLGDRVIYVGGLPTAETFAVPYLTMGVTTYSSALFNFLPHFARRFFDAVRRNDIAAVKTGLREFILPYIAIRDRDRGYAVSIVKAGANLAGRNAGRVRPPLTDLDAKSYADLEALMATVSARETPEAR